MKRKALPTCLTIIGFCLLLLSACQERRTVVDDQALGDESQGENWLSYGRTFSEQRFSPLGQINDKNIARLGVDWYRNINGSNRIFGGRAGEV